MDRTTKTVASLIAGVVATGLYFVFILPAGCADVGGVPSWERCTTVLGTPAFSVEDFGLDNTLDVIPLVLSGLLIGFITWLLLGMIGSPDDNG